MKTNLCTSNFLVMDFLFPLLFFTCMYWSVNGLKILINLNILPDKYYHALLNVAIYLLQQPLFNFGRFSFISFPFLYFLSRLNLPRSFLFLVNNLKQSLVINTSNSTKFQPHYYYYYYYPSCDRYLYINSWTVWIFLYVFN